MDSSFLMGSYYFFSKYKDYKTKDIDYLCITDNNRVAGLHFHDGNKDIFVIKNVDKEQLLTALRNTKLPMQVFKVLSLEINKHFGITIEDLKTLQDVIDRLDDKHKYGKVIYNAYLENNDFVLTDKQRDAAYEEYKKYRTN